MDKEEEIKQGQLTPKDPDQAPYSLHSS
jgi:hypothetical protein